MSFLERFDIVSAVVPVNLGAANNTGDYISLKNAARVTCVAFKGVGTAAQDPTIAVQQATTVAGGSVKNLLTARIWEKQATLLTSVGTWTLTEQTAANTFTGDGDSAEEQAIYAITVDADQLDVDNGFDCIRFNIHDVGGAEQLGCALYIIEPLVGQAILPSPIVD